MKSLSKITIKILLFTVFVTGIACPRCNAQNVNQAIIEGLTLSYYLGTGKYEEIENYLKITGYKYNPEKPSPGIKSYIKASSNSLEITSLFIDTREQDGRIGIFHASENGSFFVEKLKRAMSQSNYFRQDSTTYYFFFPNPDYNPKEKSNLPYKYVSNIIVNNDFAIFYPPLEYDNYLLWDRVFPKIFK